MMYGYFRPVQMLNRLIWPPFDTIWIYLFTMFIFKTSPNKQYLSGCIDCQYVMLMKLRLYSFTNDISIKSN